MPDKSSVACVLGGSGFLGQRLTDVMLEAGREVIVADRHPSERHAELYRYADVRETATLREALAGASVVFNLAAEWQDDVSPVERYYSVNVDGARNLCAMLTELGIKQCIFASSVSVYPFLDEEISEETTPAPDSHYGRSKLQAEDVFRTWAQEDPSRSLAIIRPTVIFGEGNRGNVYNLISQLATGRFAFVGAGNNRKSISYVENVARAFAFVEQLGPGIHLMNYSDKPDYTMRSLIPYVSKLLGRPEPKLRIPYAAAYIIGLLGDAASRFSGRKLRIRSVRVMKFASNTIYSAERVRALGYEAKVSLADALGRVVASDFTKKG